MSKLPVPLRTQPSNRSRIPRRLVVESAWGAVLPIEAGKESVVPRNRLRRNVPQSSDASEADCPATGFVSKKLSAFADGWVRRRSGERAETAGQRT